MIAPPSVMAVRRARVTEKPRWISLPENHPPARLPNMAPTKGTQPNRPICFTSKPKVSAR